MSVLQPTATVKEEIVFLIVQLLNYDSNINPSSAIQIDAKWDKENLKIKTTIERLLQLLPAPKTARTDAQRKSHLRYLLLEILDKKLNILEDRSPKNPQGNHKGVRQRIFILKFWHPPTVADYITLNLRAFDRHWNQTYNITPKVFARHNLPQPPHTKFIGHENELDKLLDFPAQKQAIISIEGMAGVGKTTLALEAAHQYLRSTDFATIVFSSAQSQQFSGSHFTRCLLAERNLPDLLQTIAQTIDCLDELPAQIEAQIRYVRSILAEQPTLLILDNIENIDEQLDIIAFLKLLPPTVKVIITSRVRLGIGQVINLNPLTVEESIALIHHQAKTLDLQIAAAELTPIRHSTGGLPLFITYIIGSIAIGRLKISAALLHPPLATSDLALYCFAQPIARLKAIPDAIAYKLLLGISLFVDGASPTALTYLLELADRSISIDPALEQLYKISLAFPTTAERYQLHSSTQEYIQLELTQQPDYAITLRNRWQNWYLDLAAPFGALDWQDWQDYSPLIADWKNLRRVVDWCIEREQYDEVLQFWQCLKGFTILGGKWLERQQWLEWLQGMAIIREDFATLADLKYHQSYTLAFIDEADGTGKAIELARSAWELHDRFVDLDFQFDLAMYIASLYIRKLPPGDAANLALASMWIDRAMAILATIPVDSPRYHHHYFQFYYYQAESQVDTGELDLAYDNYLQASQLAKQAGCQRFFHYSSGRIAVILAGRGEFTAAEKRLRQLLKGTDKYRDLRSGTICRIKLAEIKKATGDLPAARELAEQAQARFKRLGMTREMAGIDRFLTELDSHPSNDKQTKTTPSIG
jgi:hypothetical protein